MQTYSAFRPSPLDHHLTIRTEDGTSREDWLVLLSQNRDSECWEESNFSSALQLLGGESEDVEVHRFGHWLCGWLEICLVRPETAAATIAEQIEEQLADYPILVENDLGEREQEAANITWNNFTNDERLAYVRRNRGHFSFTSMKEVMACVRGKFFAGYPSELLSH